MTEYSYIKKATLAGELLTSSESQQKFREMTGTEAYHEFLRMVNSAPAEDVAPVRHGKLVEITLDEDLCNNGFCSECGSKNTAIAKYCNWCGAKMDGGGDGEN